MRKQRMRRCRDAAAILFIAFIVLWICVLCADVQPIGPENTAVGLASLNGAVARSIGFSQIWYTLTQLIGYAAILLVVFFAALGAMQWYARKKIFEVDRDLWFLGGAFLLTALLYVFFEAAAVNYRPVILDEGLEASFPSSHTMLAVSVLGCAVTECRIRLRDKKIRRYFRWALIALCVLMAAGRLLSGVHWFTDVLAGALLGGAIACAFPYCTDRFRPRKTKH